MLSREDIVAVALRVFAIYLFVTVVQYAGTLAQPMPGFDGPLGRAAILVFLMAPPLLAATLLWFFPLTVARKLLPVMRERVEPIGGDRIALQEIAFSVVGLWLFASSVPSVFYWTGLLMALRTHAREFAADATPAPEHYAGMLSDGVQLVVGIALLLGSRGAVRLWLRLRGRDRRPDDAPVP